MLQEHITVGAARYTQTPAYGVNAPAIETFSSIGGTPVNGVVLETSLILLLRMEETRLLTWAPH